MKPSDNQTPTCCICGKELPNKYAIAGTCEGKDCDAVFCTMDWRNGNHTCREHGWKGGVKQKESEITNSRTADLEDLPLDMNAKAAKETRAGKTKKGLLGRLFNKNSQSNAEPTDETSAETGDDTMSNEQEKVTQSQEKAIVKSASKETAKKAMAKTLELLKKVGSGTGALIAKLKKDRSPEAMLETFDKYLGLNRSRREELSVSFKEIGREISEKNALKAKTVPAMRGVLEQELDNLLIAFDNVEKEMKLLFENERVISKVKAGFLRLLAYDLRGVDEDTIDRLLDELDERAEDADATLDALAEMERLERRKVREDEGPSREERLARFSLDEDDVDLDQDLDLAGNEAAEPEKKKLPEDPEL